MASSSRSFSYRRSFNRHQRAVRDNTQVNAQIFHENIKDLKQYRRQVKMYMWEWMDPKCRDGVDREFRDALTQICKISSYFEDILDLTSDRTQRLLNEVEKGYQEDIKQIRRDNEGKLRRLQQSLEDLQSDNKKLSDHCEGYRRQIERLQQQIATQKDEETQYMQVTAAATNQLRDTEPSVANLSDLTDPNRPTKLAEKFSELYDTEWIIALETMEDNGIAEEDGIQILLNILTNVFTLCKDGGNKVMSAIENFIAVPAIGGLDLSQVKIESLPKFQSEVLKSLKDYRKCNREKVVLFIKEVIIKKLRETADGKRDHVMEDCKEYIDKAIEYCWMMRVQDPPVHIEWNFSIGSNFNTDKFRSYTKGGHYVSFVVWPVLYLHENGPLLAKGVVQGNKNK